MSDSLNQEHRYRFGAAAGNQAGFALPAVLLLMMVLSTVSVFFLLSSSDQQRAGRAMRESTRTLYAAEAGVNLIMARWDSLQYDTLFANTGDSVTLAWETLPENGCSFRAVLQRVDDGSGALAYFAKVWGRGVGSFGGQRNLGVVLNPGVASAPIAGMTLGGGGLTEISGSPTITGPCASVHSNGDIYKGAKGLTLDGEYTTVGTADQGGYLDSFGNPHTPTEGVPSLPIPPLNPLDYCPGSADWILRNGYIIDVLAADSAVVNSAGDVWQWDLNIDEPSIGFDQYELGAGGNPQNGTVCVFGNVALSGGAGADGAPIDMSIIATGNIELTGTSFISGDTDGIALLAGGDLWLTGSSGVSSDNFDGLIYANGDCEMSGSSSIKGAIVCAGNTLPVFAPDITPFGNEFTGSFTIEFDCTTPFDSSGASVTISPGSWTDLTY